jgi:hypothetical protein
MNVNYPLYLDNIPVVLVVIEGGLDIIKKGFVHIY